jgi:hypothetical protein
MPAMSGLYYIQNITCDTLSVSLGASSSTLNTILYWDDNSTAINDSLANPLNINYSGGFTCTVIDTGNGCSINGSILTQTDTTKPGLTIFPDTTYITCSATMVILDASSSTSGAILSWAGPSAFSSSDPASVTQQGTYFVQCVKPSNGCFRTDSVFVGLISTLTVYAGNDTVICPGSSASYSAYAPGGTAPYAYAWSNGDTSAAAIFSPADTTVYTVVVTDANSCVGSDTVVVFIPAALNDSIQTYKPCDAGIPNGQINVYAYGGIAPCQFSIDGGINFQSSIAFTGMNYGTYPILIRDTLGCTKNDTAIINLQSAAFQADFLVASNSFADSVLVLVDICDPRPDSIWWEIPFNASLSGPDSTGTQYFLTVADTGAYAVIMHAVFGNCEDTDTANVQLMQWDSTYAIQSSGGIDSVNVFPNPAPGGQFNVYVKLNKKQTFALYVFNASGTEIWRTSIYESDLYSAFITLPNPVPGTYLLRIVAEYDARNLLIEIPQ